MESRLHACANVVQVVGNNGPGASISAFSSLEKLMKDWFYLAAKVHHKDDDADTKPSHPHSNGWNYSSVCGRFRLAVIFMLGESSANGFMNYLIITHKAAVFKLSIILQTFEYFIMHSPTGQNLYYFKKPQETRENAKL